MYLLQQLNIHSNIRDQMTDGYMYVGQPTYNYTWFSRYVCMPAMLYEIYNREVHGTKQQHIVRGNVLFSSSPEYILWQYGLWSFQTGDTKLERFLPNNQHTQRKLLNFEFWINGELSKSAKI